jgi:hypothetical protein
MQKTLDRSIPAGDNSIFTVVNEDGLRVYGDNSL